MNRLYVCNLRWSIDDDQLRNIFKEAGTIVSANIIIDRETGRSRGFGFVEMATEEEAKKAIELFNGMNIDGRPIVVREALPEGKSSGEEVLKSVSFLIKEFTDKAVIGQEYSFSLAGKSYIIIREG